jgi:hypothetical protein
MRIQPKTQTETEIEWQRFLECNELCAEQRRGLHAALADFHDKCTSPQTDRRGAPRPALMINAGAASVAVRSRAV